MTATKWCDCRKVFSDETKMEPLRTHVLNYLTKISLRWWLQDNWNTDDISFLPIWLEGHQLACEQLGKPLVLEEFGKVRHD